MKRISIFILIVLICFGCATQPDTQNEPAQYPWEPGSIDDVDIEEKRFIIDDSFAQPQSVPDRVSYIEYDINETKNFSVNFMRSLVYNEFDKISEYIGMLVIGYFLSEKIETYIPYNVIYTDTVLVSNLPSDHDYYLYRIYEDESLDEIYYLNAKSDTLRIIRNYFLSANDILIRRPTANELDWVYHFVDNNIDHPVFVYEIGEYKLLFYIKEFMMFFDDITELEWPIQSE